MSLTADVAADKQASADKSNPTVQTETEGGDDDTADEEPCSTSAVLGNILDNTNQEFLEMLVENITKSHDFTLEFFPDISSAVVTFQSGEGTHFRMKSSYLWYDNIKFNRTFDAEICIA